MPSTASVHAPALASAISAPPPPSRDWALFLDLDGTLCGYRDIPADVALSPPQQAVLGQPLFVYWSSTPGQAIPAGEGALARSRLGTLLRKAWAVLRPPGAGPLRWAS